MTDVLAPPAPVEPLPPSRRRWRRLFVLASVVLVVGLAAVALAAGLARDARVPPSALLDRPAPSLAGPLLSGGEFDPATTQGDVTLVNVWASWCSVCKEEMPVLNAAAEQLGPRGLVMVGINTQDREPAARQFLAETGGEMYPNIVDPDGALAATWGTFGVPETYLVDREGVIRSKVVGAVTPEWFRTVVAAELDRAGGDR